MNEFVIKQVATNEQTEKVPENEGETEKIGEDLDSGEQSESEIAKNSDIESPCTEIADSPEGSFESQANKDLQTSKRIELGESEDSESWGEKFPPLPLYSPMEIESEKTNGE